MILTINGRVISKKNNNRWNGRFVYKGKAWTSFEKEAVSQLRSLYKGEPIKGEVDICYTFYLKGKGNQDSDNLLGSINDILQKAGVLENDRQIRTGSFALISGEPEYKTELVIQEQ